MNPVFFDSKSMLVIPSLSKFTESFFAVGNLPPGEI